MQTNSDSSVVARRMIVLPGLNPIARPHRTESPSVSAQLAVAPSPVRALSAARREAIRAQRWETAAWWVLGASSVAALVLSAWP